METVQHHFDLFFDDKIVSSAFPVQTSVFSNVQPPNNNTGEASFRMSNSSESLPVLQG